MHFLKLTSINSYWRGHDYYLNKNVLSWSKESDNIYCGQVKGNNGNIYDVRINSLRGKKSTCNCEFAKGRYVVCKHMVALYLTVFPGKDVEREEYYEKEYNDYILQLNKEKENKKTVIVGATIYTLVAVGLFILFYPVISGQPVSLDFAEQYLKWFKSWVLVA